MCLDRLQFRFRRPGTIQINIAIMRTFVRLRQMLASHDHLARKRPALPDFIRAEGNYDTPFKALFDAIRKLMTPQHPRNA